MRSFPLHVCVGVSLLAASLCSAAPGNGARGAIYERLICVVPLVGAGTPDDPKRPMFAPADGTPQTAKPSKGFQDPPAIVAFRSVPTDDGQNAIVQFVARDRAAFKSILAQRTSLLFVADPHLQPSATLIENLRKFNKNFDLGEFLRGGL